MPKIVESDESIDSLSDMAYHDLNSDNNPRGRGDDYDLLDECYKSARRILRKKQLTAGELRAILVEAIANNVWEMI